MSEQKLIHKQLIKNMLYNLIAFTILFSIFGVIIFSTVKTFLYQSSTQELTEAKQRYSNIQDQPIFKGEKPDISIQGNFKKEEKRDIFPNPRIISIQRDENGQVQNTDEIGRFYENYISEIAFDKSNLDNIEEIVVNDKYYYRMITFETTNSNGEVIYIQLLVNIDSEKAVLNNFLNILSIGIIVTVVCSIVASYILSKRTLKPIIESWRKQTEFVQNASHELRTPLTIIQAKQELLLQEPESKIIDKSEEIRLTLNETKRLTKLTKDLMILARADQNKIQLNKEQIDIDKYIKEIATPYIDFAGIQEKDIKLNLNYGKEVLVDVSRFHELMVILLDNSIKYTKQGDKIEIKTYSKDSKFVVEVKDTGIGISDEAKKHIFERFYREDKARSRQTGGTGLGLSIAYFIVNSHGGIIKVEDNIPKGSVFIIKLPK